MQTCDTVRYVPLLEIGSQTVKAYITKFGYSYISFIGIRRGQFAWQASYNRIPMLMEMVEASYSGWVCYMDADSYVVDLGFDLEAYLIDKGDVAFVAAHSGVQPPRWFDVNNGVFLINLGHAKGKELVKRWHARFMAISDADIGAADVWGDIENDQALLHLAMQDIPDLESHSIVDMSHLKLLNYETGRFIRQILREDGGTIEERAAAMLSDVKAVMSSQGMTFGTVSAPIHSDASMLEESFIRALYRIFLLRDPTLEELYPAIKRFNLKNRSIEQELKDCLSSPEFAGKSEEFLRRFAPNSDVLN